MAKFKCLLSGNVVEFTQEHDVEAMRKHPQYEEVVSKPVEKEVKQPVKAKE